MLNYNTWIFDCDGVLLDSNRMKSDVFYEIALPFGQEPANELRDYNKKHGGISRNNKIQHFVLNILQKEESLVTELLKQYKDKCSKKLMDCTETMGIRQFISDLPKGVFKYVVSGGPEEEVRWVLDNKGLSSFFNGIFGYPLTKYDIIDRIKTSCKSDGLNLEWKEPSVIIGDSLLDYEVSTYAGSDFIFMTEFSEFHGWNNFFCDKKCFIVHNAMDLIDVLRHKT